MASPTGQYRSFDTDGLNFCGVTDEGELVCWGPTCETADTYKICELLPELFR